MDRRAPGYASDQLDTMPSLPRTYSSGRSLNDVAPEEDTLGRQHEPEEKLNAPLPSAKSSGPRRAVPWYKKVGPRLRTWHPCFDPDFFQIIPTSTPCRLLLLTILIELVVDLSIEVSASDHSRYTEALTPHRPTSFIAFTQKFILQIQRNSSWRTSGVYQSTSSSTVSLSQSAQWLYG